jgi:hypothetical protein
MQHVDSKELKESGPWGGHDQPPGAGDRLFGRHRLELAMVADGHTLENSLAFIEFRFRRFLSLLY